jgi:hypothetical protein
MGRHKPGRNKTALVAVLFLCLFLSGCVTLKDPEASQDYSADLVGVIGPGQTVGQTFVSRRPRLNQVQLWLRQVKAPLRPDSQIIAELYAHPQAEQPLARVPIPYTEMARSLLVTIPLPPQSVEPNRLYYLLLKTGDGVVNVLGRAEDAYAPGGLYVNGQPVEADAAFRLGYDYDTGAMASDLGKAISGGWLALPLLALLWAPGRLLVTLIEGQIPLDWGERNALAVGLSMAFVPVAMLWTTTLKLHWGRGVVILVYALIALGLAWRFWRNRPARHHVSLDATSLALGAILAFSLAIRLVMVRDLVAPAWVDPVHHAAITRMIIEQGGYPQSYAALVEAPAGGYHPGFHSLAAAFHWLSGLELPENLLLLGQVLNAACILGVYLFTVTLTQDRRAGLFAALIAGVFSPMPAYYTSWGRYTQLAGLVILPAALKLIQIALQNHEYSRAKRTSLWGMAALACSGLFLTHYRVAAFLALLLIAHLLGEVIRHLDKRPLWKTLPVLLGELAALVGISLLITLPWWPVFYPSMIAPRLALPAPAPAPLAVDWGLLTPAYGKAALILAAAGLIWSVIRARWFGAVLMLWIGLLYLSANQGMLRLPVSTGINKTSVEITLFLPIAVLGGYLISDLIYWAACFLPRLPRKLFQTGIVAITIWAALLGAQKLLPILNPSTLLFRQADRAAIRWIDANLPQDAQILINPFLWGYGLYAGSDGGFWITPLTGRATLPPPVLYGLGSKEEILAITQPSRQTLELGKNPEGLHKLMHEQGLGYVYAGVRSGPISPSALSKSPLFEVVYRQDGVTIFRAR